MTKKKPIKIRKSWIRNPTEQVVENKHEEENYDPRQAAKEALEELEDSRGDEFEN